ncbi:MAG: hypothetical protein U0836_27515 [Pirellulales bacterium]
MIDDELLDDLFHGCAAAAYIDVARRQPGPPCSERTRQRAYELYEQALAARTEEPFSVRS